MNDDVASFAPLDTEDRPLVQRHRQDPDVCPVSSSPHPSSPSSSHASARSTTASTSSSSPTFCRRRAGPPITSATRRSTHTRAGARFTELVAGAEVVFGFPREDPAQIALARPHRDPPAFRAGDVRRRRPAARGGRAAARRRRADRLDELGRRPRNAARRVGALRDPRADEGPAASRGRQARAPLDALPGRRGCAGRRC